MSKSIRRSLLAAVSAVSVLATVPGCSQPPQQIAPEDQGKELLQFNATEANVRNYFYRRGTIAAHLLTTSGTYPRVVWGFPAQNTGIGVWFEAPATPTEITADADADGNTLTPARPGNGMWGVTAMITSDAPALRIRKTVIGNVRTVRDYFYGATIPPEFDFSTTLNSESLTFTQDCLDGKHHIRLKLDFVKGTSAAVDGSQIVFHGGSDGKIHLRATATIDYDPVTPIEKKDLVTSAAANNEKALNALAFLSYQEKLMAGSWRFLTYFGRDTMLSLRMLMPVLQPSVVEAGLGAVIDRIDPNGNVAHEEALGDYAWFVRINNKEPAPPAPQTMFSPWLDYKMIDPDFELPAVLGVYAATDPGKSRMQAFLARKTPSGATYQDVLKKNIDLVISLTQPFVDNPIATNLVRIKHPEVGNWRDSGTGLGYGKYPYDVNTALVPAALRGAADLYAAGLLGGDANAMSTKLNSMAQVWETQAEPFFRVAVPFDLAQDRVKNYAQNVGLDPAAALASLPNNGVVRYHAVSLDDRGFPVDVMNTDDSFVMEFTNPSDETLQEAANNILRPFPAGLRTDSGIVVASTALAQPDSALHAVFTRGDYHGTVIWSWQQAMLAAGLERQLKRTDLQPETVSMLTSAQASLWQVINASQALGTGELWSWAPSADKKKAEYVSFAQAATDLNRFVDESNAIQLWSTVYLAVQQPH